MKITKQGKDIHMTFESVSEVMDYIQDTPAENDSRNNRRSKDSCPFSWEDTIRFFREGWPEGVRDIAFNADRINDRIDEATGHGIEYDVTGDYIDVGSYLEGVPECFGKMVTADGPKEEIEIVVSAVCHSGIHERSIRNRGAAIAALVDQLRRTHFVKLSFVIKTVQIEEHNITTVFNVNMENDYSRDMVAFFAANACYLRRIWFAVAEKVLRKSSCGFYGSVGNVTVSKGKICFPSIDSNEEWNTLEKASKKVQEFLNNINP